MVQNFCEFCVAASLKQALLVSKPIRSWAVFGAHHPTDAIRPYRGRFAFDSNRLDLVSTPATHWTPLPGAR